MFQGEVIGKRAKKMNASGLQDPAALLWGRQDILKRTLSELKHKILNKSANKLFILVSELIEV